MCYKGCDPFCSTFHDFECRLKENEFVTKDVCLIIFYLESTKDV